jgi:N-acetylgalactosamine-N,N'-diacetylbacillosaminyl-diphospho-undecaprenol 4-alpha-N-acetylgalactosaminyltransferase
MRRKGRVGHMVPKKRVVFIINSLAGGGAERVMSTLVMSSRLERDEFEIALVLLDIERNAYEISDGIEVHQLDCRHSLLRSVVSLLLLFRRLRPEISISFLPRANVASVLASFIWRNPCIISERGSTSEHFTGDLAGSLARFLVRTIYSRATRIIAVSHGVARDLRFAFSVPKEKIVVIANPIDISSIQAQSREKPFIDLNEPYVIGMGRLDRNKNFALLIGAFAESGLHGKLVILGEGPEREALIRKIDDLGLTDRVLMPGFAKNPFALLCRADAFVLPSSSEGFPNCLLEAMAVGVPVISTNCAWGPSEILADRDRSEIDGLCFAEYGILVPTESPRLMAKALLAMASSDLRHAYARKAAARASEFTIEKVKRRYWEVVRKEL